MSTHDERSIVTPAAPPVAEGLAATPRLPIATDHCLQCGIHLAPKEELGGLCTRHKPSSNSVTFPAAAAPSEARAAAQFFEEYQKRHRLEANGGHLTAEHTRDMCNFADAYAADLLRQLDNSRRERERLRTIYSEFTQEIRAAVHGEEWGFGRDHYQYVLDVKKLRERAESAEAANQELRRALQEIVDYDDEFSDTTPREIAAAALLGPQHAPKSDYVERMQQRHRLEDIG